MHSFHQTSTPSRLPGFFNINHDIIPPKRKRLIIIIFQRQPRANELFRGSSSKMRTLDDVQILCDANDLSAKFRLSSSFHKVHLVVFTVGV
jgi:hypothetical protein